MTTLAILPVVCLSLAALVNSVAALRETRRLSGKLEASLRLLLEAVQVTDQTADRMVEIDQRTKWLELTQASRVELYQ